MKQFSYCVNALCDQRLNEGHTVTVCQSCSASLLVNNRYRLIKQMRPDKRQKRLQVYEAIDIETNETVILKINEMQTKNVVNYLKRECEVLTCFPPKYFPRQTETRDYFEWHPIPDIDGLVVSGLVLPKIEGSNSADWIEENGPISQDKAIAWMQQILPYLKRLNEIAYLHRDIKPSNIMVSPDGDKLTLIDYETCRKIDDDYMSIISGNVVNQKKDQYRQITRVFSAGFTAPEQNDGRALPQSDLFSFGRSAVYWITGQSPSTLVDFETNKIDWSKVEKHHFNQCFTNFLDQLVDPNPTKRFLTLEEIEQELNQGLPQKIIKENREKSKFRKITRVILTTGLITGALLLTWFSIAKWFQDRGIDALLEGNLRKARSELDKSLAINPWSEKSLYYLGTVCQGLNDNKCSENSYEKALSLDPKSTRTLYHLGVLNQERGDIQIAKQLFQRSLNLKPNPEAFNRLARLEIEQKQYTEAQIYIQKGLSIASDQDMKSRLHYHQGQIYYQQEQWQKAEQSLSRAKEFQGTADALCLLAKTKEQLKRPTAFINALWYRCFYADTQYPEGKDYKENILDRALLQDSQ